MELLEAILGNTDYISIALGIISLILGIISLIVSIISLAIAMHYRKIDNKINEIKDSIQRGENYKKDVIYIRCRNTDRIVSQKQGIVLHKDCVRVVITEKYKKANKNKVIETIDKVCPSILKKAYIDHLKNQLQEDDLGGKGIDLTLRYEYNQNDLKKIEAVNNELEPLGLHFEFIGGD